MDRWINGTTDLGQIAVRLALTFAFCLCMSFCIGLYSQNAALKQELVARDAVSAQANEDLDAAFSGIYETLELISNRYRVISDTHVRTQHYTKPHTTFQKLCPECADLGGVKKEGIAWVPAARLETLYEIERLARGFPKVAIPEDVPEPPIDVLEELKSVGFLLKSHSSFSYTLLQAEMYTNHYAKKHSHPIPGLKGFGNCPECIALYEKQTTDVQPIPKKRYEELLKLERDRKGLRAALDFPEKSHGK